VVWTLVVAVALAAKPPAPAAVKLAAPGLNGFNVSPAELEFFTEHFAQQLTLQGLQVTTARQISSLLGLERQREIMGCKDAATSCMAELAAALGVEGVVTGSVGKFETSYRVNVSIVAASDGHTLAAYSARATTSEEVLEKLTTGAKQMAGEVLRALRNGAAPAPDLRVERIPPVNGNVRPAAPAPGWGLRPSWWMPAAGAGAVAVVGTVFAVQARQRYQDIAQAPSYNDAAKASDAGKLDQTLASISYGATGLGLVATAIFFLSGDPAAPPPLAGGVHLAPARSGVALTWSWP
jgi:TolB-like protein